MLQRRDFKKEIFGLHDLFALITKAGKFIGGILTRNGRRTAMTADIILGPDREDDLLYLFGNSREELKKYGTFYVTEWEKIHAGITPYDEYFGRKIVWN